jgi:hypothetical protein
LEHLKLVFISACLSEIALTRMSLVVVVVIKSIENRVSLWSED